MYLQYMQQLHHLAAIDSLNEADVLFQDGSRIPVDLGVDLRVVRRASRVAHRHGRPGGLEKAPGRHGLLRQSFPGKRDTQQVTGDWFVVKTTPIKKHTHTTHTNA